nr:DUF3352 domain-containing protein [Propionibacterium sp.]
MTGPGTPSHPVPPPPEGGGGPGRPVYEYGVPTTPPPPPGAPAQPQFSYGPPPGGQVPYGTPQDRPWFDRTVAQPPLAVPPVAPPPKRRFVPLAVGVAVLALVGAGAAILPRLLGGSGPQPAAVVPAQAVAYASFDLNPTLAQKAAAAQFLNKFPAFQGRLTDSTDLRRVVFEQLQRGEDPVFEEFDYDADVKPWLGDRFAVTAVPGESRALGAVVLAVTDEAKAKASLQRLTASDDATECRVADGFAVCAERGTLAQVTVTDRARSLEANQAFAADVAAVPGDAVGTFWADLGAAAALVPTDSGTGNTVAGRLAGKVRFDGAAAVELAGVSRGVRAATDSGVPSGTRFDLLPAGTLAALSINGLGRQVQGAWPEISQQVGEESIEALGSSLGLALPDDLALLLGDHSTLAFGGMGALGLPELALVTDGDQALAARVAARTGGFLSAREVSGSTVLATSGTFAGTVTSGGLTGLPAFQAAVPNAQSADAVAYVDIPGLLNVAGPSFPAENRVNLDPLQAVGLAATQRGSEGTFTVRVTTR